MLIHNASLTLTVHDACMSPKLGYRIFYDPSCPALPALKPLKLANTSVGSLHVDLCEPTAQYAICH